MKNDLLAVLLLLTHALSLAVWIGVMLFNLIVNFPAQRARAGGAMRELTLSMGSQARRAAPWLCVLVVLTALSGWGLQQVLDQALGPTAWEVSLIKWAGLAAMVMLHVWASLRVWPRIYFALDAERPGLFLQYQLSMGGSALIGILLMTLSYGARF